MTFETKKIRLHTLAPVFIGDGSELDFTTCWIDEEKGELVAFAPEALKLTDEEISRLGSLDAKGFKRLIQDKRPEGIRIKVSKDIIAQYNNDLNNGYISRTISDPNTRKPYVPGSSLKGALRTAYISQLPETKNSNHKLNNKDLQTPLGSFAEDVFSTLKVSDFISEKEIKKDILFVDRVSKKTFSSGRNVSKDGRKHMVVSRVEAIRAGSVFEGALTLTEKYKTTKMSFSGIEEVLKNIDDYSFSLLEDKKIAIPYPSAADIKNIKNGFKNKTYLCRLGGLIGAESHTIEGHRSIKINQGQGNRPTYEDYTTRTLFASATKEKSADNNTTFGWCLIEVLNGSDSPSVPAELETFLEKQEKTLFADMNIQTVSANANNHGANYRYGNNRRPAQTSWQNNAISINNAPKKALDRNKTYEAKVVNLSKKGSPIADIDGRNITVAVSSGKAYQVGDTIFVSSINGTTGKEVVK